MDESEAGDGRVLRRGLLARLASGGQRISELESIVSNLHQLLNTRVGEALAASDLGIIDFADVVHSFPEATQVLLQSIRATIIKYEPRLRSVAVHPVQGNDPLSLAFEISARMNTAQRGNFRLRTELTANGRMKVSGH